MKQQLALFFAALQFYTRFPVPNWIEYRPENLGLATRFLPVIGYIVGGIAGTVWVITYYFTDVPIAILLSMVASILMTGAFHEDGFADVCDGFGGGWTKEKILLIMKDSRIGTYGAVGLVLILALKFCLLQFLSGSVQNNYVLILLILISAHSMSRLMPALVIFSQPYARDTDDSKAKPVAESASVFTVVIAAIFAIIPLIFLAWMLKTALLFLVIVFLLMITFFLTRYFKKWIGGYTGDCLGAVQQVSEIGFYLFLAILWRFI